MPSELTTRAVEQSTYIITASFTDEDGNAVAPKTLSWTLSDAGGTVVNSREDVAVSSPTANQDIVLSGNDLRLQSGEALSAVRVLTVEGTYDSDAGSDLPLKESVRFPLDDLKMVT